MTSQPDLALAQSDQVRDRINDALVLLNSILDANPYGVAIADPLTTRTQLLLAGHHVEAAMWALAKLMP
jgi:hypothetical protein